VGCFTTSPLKKSLDLCHWATAQTTLKIALRRQSREPAQVARSQSLPEPGAAPETMSDIAQKVFHTLQGRNRREQKSARLCSFAV
jgi:hypothetical protein